MNDMALESARKRREDHLGELMEILAIPSVSTLPEHRADVRACAEWIADQLRRLHLEQVDIISTPGHPVVYAEWLHAPGRPTVLVYGHYDVQPVDPLDEWASGPFDPAIRDDYVYARGASDMKGQIFAQIKALECLWQDGYPFNVKYLIEGEEEIGSPNLPAFIEQHREKLACDFVLNCDSFIQAKDQPSIVYGLRGLAYFEIEIRGAKSDLHSGRFGGAIPNPAAVLCELIAGTHDGNGRVTLPGFYDKVRDIDAEERAALAKLPYSDEAWLTLSGAAALSGEEGYTTIERIGARPTLEVNGIWGGFTGEGAKTVLPAVARAKVSMRLVADQDHRDMAAMLSAYLDANAPAGVAWSLKDHGGGPGAIMDRRSKYMEAAVAAMTESFNRPPLFTREGGSVPVVGIMQQQLGVDSVMMGFALPDDNIHAPNERQYLPNFYKGIETYIRFMQRVGGL